MNIRFLLGITALVCLSACSTSGLDASSNFKCSYADNFAGCSSLSKVYDGSVNGGALDKTSLANTELRKGLYSGMPVRTPESILRIWIAPWEDKEGDLRDQSFVYVAVRSSKWNISHNFENIIEEYRPTIRLLGDGTSNSASDGNSEKAITNENWLDKAETMPDTTKDPLQSPPNLIPDPK